MNKKEAFGKGLPKWPQMRIIGEPVSEELAKEIIIRTDTFFDSMHSSNSHTFDKECRKICCKWAYYNWNSQICQDINKNNAIHIM